MRVSFTVFDLVLAAFFLAAGMWGHITGDIIVGVSFVIHAAWAWFLVDWKNGWDGRYDCAWILNRRNKWRE